MPDDQITPAQFLGLKGAWKSVANFGLAGVLSGLAVYVTTITLPGVQYEFHESLKAEREAARDEIKAERAAARADSEKSREHGNHSAREIGEAVRSLTETLIEVQTRTHANQERLIELQAKTLKAKEPSE